MNLVPVGPRVDLTPREHTRAFRLACHRATRAANLREEITSKITLYNLLLRKLPRELRAQSSLFVIGHVWQDSPHVSLPTRGIPSSGPRLAGPSRADLRIEARRNKVPLPTLWQRFPPSDLFERRQMQRELSDYYRRAAIVSAKQTKDGFAAFLQQQARGLAKAAGDPSLAGRYLASSEWKQEQRKIFDEISSIELDLDI